MIVYDLRCEQEHLFEGWFPSSGAFDAQRAAGEVVCPVCASTAVEKALMAPNVAAKSNSAPANPPAKPPSDPKPTADDAVQMLAKMRKTVEDNCDYVGKGFAEEARKIHYGETDPRGIYGEASKEDAAELSDEGIDFAEIPWVPNAEN